jgi:hypothetical protein
MVLVCFSMFERIPEIRDFGDFWSQPKNRNLPKKKRSPVDPGMYIYISE